VGCCAEEYLVCCFFSGTAAWVSIVIYAGTGNKRRGTRKTRSRTNVKEYINGSGEEDYSEGVEVK